MPYGMRDELIDRLYCGRGANRTKLKGIDKVMSRLRLELVTKACKIFHLNIDRWGVKLSRGNHFAHSWVLGSIFFSLNPVWTEILGHSSDSLLFIF